METVGKRVIIVGANPSNTPTPVAGRLRKDSTFDKLERWSNELRIEHFGFINAAQKRGVVKQWDVDYAFLSQCLKGHTKILALGGFPSEALRRLNISHHKLPHPSPRNRAWNDKSYEARVISECKEYLNS